MFIPNSTMFRNTCTCCCGWTEPPITPKLMKNSPSLKAIAGMIVWKGRLCGAATLTCPSSNENNAARFCSVIPVSGTTSPEPNDAKML